MTEQTTDAVASPEAAFSITRVVDAPRDLVWKAWTEADHLKHWWGPAGWEMKVCTVDLQPGGLFHYGMSMPEGEMWGKWVFREITPQERLVFINSFSDEQGNTHAPPFADPWPAEMLSTVLFSEQDGKTLLTLSAIPINATDEQVATFVKGHSSMEQGFGGTFDQLDAYLKKA